MATEEQKSRVKRMKCWNSIKTLIFNKHFTFTRFYASREIRSVQISAPLDSLAFYRTSLKLWFILFTLSKSGLLWVHFKLNEVVQCACSLSVLGVLFCLSAKRRLSSCAKLSLRATKCKLELTSGDVRISRQASSVVKGRESLNWE